MEPTCDNVLATEVAAALHADGTVPAGSVIATVRAGVATLTGELAWQSQRAAAREAAASVPGIIATFNATTLSRHSWQQK